MRSTLFFIPHELAGVPLFGIGWLLAALVLAALATTLWSLVRKQPLRELSATWPVWLMAVAIVVFILPQVEVVLPNGAILGLPIRGYGVMVLLGLLTGIGITVYRGGQLGIVSDTIIGLGFWMMLGGIVGARLFYVVQKWDDFVGLDGWQRLIDIVKLTEGGLVIYGGVVGGLIAGGVFCWRHHLPLAATADLIAPGFLLGLSFGRIGCLLHGCCFGGVCTAELPAIQFPAGSIPYTAQISSGQLLGIELRDAYQPPGIIAEVRPGSLAEQAQIAPGEQLKRIARSEEDQSSSPFAPPQIHVEVQTGEKWIGFEPQDLPAWSLPVHPSQIYASFNALLLCLLVWHIQPLPNRDGVAFGFAVLLYAISRFLLELIRSDEAGQLGTPFTISQLVAMGSGLIAVAAILICYKTPPRREWDWPKAAKL